MIDKHDEEPLTLFVIAREPTGDLWNQELGGGGWMREVKYHALHIMCPQMGGDICIPLFYCQQRCLNLIKRLIAFLCFDSLGWRMTKSKQVRLA